MLIKVSCDIIIRPIYNVHFSLYLYLLKMLMTCVEGVWFYCANQLNESYLKINPKAISPIVQKMPIYVIKAEIVFAKAIWDEGSTQVQIMKWKLTLSIFYNVKTWENGSRTCIHVLKLVGTWAKWERKRTAEKQKSFFFFL